jgi:hypothetical protein
MNTIEGNKLIAEFHRGKYNPNAIYLYHDRWDELMPVVEKIESLGYSVNILRDDCSIYDNSFKHTGSGFRISIKNTNDKIKSVLQAVIQFIEWYNKEQSVQVSDTTKA